MRVEGPAGGGVQWASTMQHAVDKTEGRLLSPGSHAAQAIERNTTVCDVSEHDAGYNWTVGCDTQQGIPLN